MQVVKETDYDPKAHKKMNPEDQPPVNSSSSSSLSSATGTAPHISSTSSHIDRDFLNNDNDNGNTDQLEESDSDEFVKMDAQQGDTYAEQRTNDVSNKLGQYMLQGWALLGSVCPRCNCPYMRNPQTLDLLCVSCEETISADKPDKADTDESQLANNSGSSSLSTPAVVSQHTQFDESPSGQRPKSRKKKSKANPQKNSSSSSSSSSSSRNDELTSAVTDAEDALIFQLNQCTDCLKSTYVTSNETATAEDVVWLAKGVTHLVQALSAIKQFRQ